MVIIPRPTAKPDLTIQVQCLEAARKRHDFIAFAMVGGIIGLAFKLPDMFPLLTADLIATNTLVFIALVMAFWNGGHEHFTRQEKKFLGRELPQSPFLKEIGKYLMWLPIGLLIMFKGIPTLIQLIICIITLTG